MVGTNDSVARPSYTPAVTHPIAADTDRGRRVNLVCHQVHARYNPTSTTAAMDSTTSCAASMAFHTQGSTCLLFPGWQVDTAGQYVGAAAVIFLLALLREVTGLVRSYREAALAVAKQVSCRMDGAPGADADAAATPSLPPSVTSSNTPMQESVPTSLADRITPRSLLARISRSEVRLQCLDSMLLVVHMGFGYLLMLLVMSFQLYIFILVLISSFVAHAVTHILYKPWIDDWQRRQQDYLQMLDVGAGQNEERWRG